MLQYLMSSSVEGNTRYGKEAFLPSGPQTFFVPGPNLDVEAVEKNQVRSLLRRSTQCSKEGRPLNSHLHPLA